MYANYDEAECETCDEPIVFHGDRWIHTGNDIRPEHKFGMGAHGGVEMIAATPKK